MGIAGAFKRSRKEDRFVSLLIQQTEITHSGMELLESWLKDLNREIEGKSVEKMKRMEREADEVRRVLIDDLHNTFVTPLDREDMFMLSLYIDNIMDYAYTTVEEMHLLEIEPDEHLLGMVALIKEATGKILLAIKRLNANPRLTAEHANNAKKQHNEVEHIYRVAIGELFKKAKDFKQLMVMLRRREVYRHVSNMADRIDDAADVLGMIVMKII